MKKGQVLVLAAILIVFIIVTVVAAVFVIVTERTEDIGRTGEEKVDESLMEAQSAVTISALYEDENRVELMNIGRTDLPVEEFDFFVDGSHNKASPDDGCGDVLEEGERCYFKTEGDQEPLIGATRVKVSGPYGTWDEALLEVEVYHVKIDPDEDRDITDGDMVEFSAKAYDEHNIIITDEDTDFEWYADEGTITDDGTFEETEAGSYYVTAEYEGVASDPTTVTVEDRSR